MHVHVYELAKMWEFQVDTKDPVKARESALKMMKDKSDDIGNQKSPDCKYIALTFDD